MIDRKDVNGISVIGRIVYATDIRDEGPFEATKHKLFRFECLRTNHYESALAMTL